MLDAQVLQGPSHLRKRFLLHRPASLGGMEEMTGPVRIKAAKQPLFQDGRPQDLEHFERALFLEELRCVHLAGRIVTAEHKRLALRAQMRKPGVLTAVAQDHHTWKRTPFPALPVACLTPAAGHQACTLQGSLHPFIAQLHTLLLNQFLVKVPHIEPFIFLPVQAQHLLHRLQWNPLRARPLLAPVKQSVVTVLLIPPLPPPHRPGAYPQDLRRLHPQNLPANRS